MIVSKILEGEISFKNLINEVLKINNTIEIVVFMDEEEEDVKKFLYEKGIYKIFQNNQVCVEELENILENETAKSKELLAEEVKKLKRIIEEQKLSLKESVGLGKITAVTGNYGVRKKHFILYIM